MLGIPDKGPGAQEEGRTHSDQGQGRDLRPKPISTISHSQTTWKLTDWQVGKDSHESRGQSGNGGRRGDEVAAKCSETAVVLDVRDCNTSEWYVSVLAGETCNAGTGDA